MCVCQVRPPKPRRATFLRGKQFAMSQSLGQNNKTIIDCFFLETPSKFKIVLVLEQRNVPYQKDTKFNPLSFADISESFS